MPPWAPSVAPLFFLAGLSWELFVSGLLLIVRPSAMAGTRLERLWLDSNAPQWSVGLLFACSGLCFMAAILLDWASGAGILSGQGPVRLVVGLILLGAAPYLLRGLWIPLLDRRRNETMRQPPRV
jgi:hypothetical protein